MARTVQVFTFGHALSEGTKAYLRRTYGAYRVHKAFFHAPQLQDVPGAALATLRTLQKQKADFSGQAITLFALPGLGSGAVMLAFGWAGVTGEGPRVLNLMKSADGTYIPSPECPELDCHEFKNQVGRQLRASFFDGVELEAA